MNNYNAKIISNRSPEECFKAITEEMSDWWTPMSGKFLKIGDKAKTDFGGKSYWSFEAIKLNNPDYIELSCYDAYHIHEGSSDKIKTEWLGTKLIFEIIEIDGKSNIDFTHEGLIPELECFEVCMAGWDHFFLKRLKDHLNAK